MLRRVTAMVVHAAAALALMAAGAHAQSLSESRRLYQQGAFMQAASVAERASGAGASAFAARALLAQVVVDPQADTVGDTVARARRNAERALTLDPNSVDARLQLAVALGLEAHRMPMHAALASGAATEARRLIDEAIALNPREAWAHALLGNWHLEVVRRGGPLAAAAFGASYEAGVAAFRHARRLAPQDPVIALQFASALLALQPDAHQSSVRRLLDVAAEADPQDALEAFACAQAVTLREVLAAEGPAAARARLHAMAG
jgi:tetratricopeptide (TPR) repeat protein